MMSTENSQQLERKAASVARAELKSSLLSAIRSTFKRQSGKMQQSTVTNKFVDGLLDRMSINSPKYSFTEHFGSDKSGTQGATSRSESEVKSFQRHLGSKVVPVAAHHRSGADVRAFNKNRRYLAKNHIARALNNTNALDKLATAIGESRAVIITSQIDF